MPDGSVGFFHQIYDGAKYLVFALIGLLTWNGKRLFEKVDNIEKNYVSEETYNASLRSLRDSIDKGFDQMREDVRGIHQRIDKVVDKK